MSDLNIEQITEEPDPLADELDAFLTARLAGQQLSPPGQLPAAERGMAEALLLLAETMQPDPSFAAQLAAELRERAAARATPAQTLTPARRRFAFPWPTFAQGWPVRAAGLALLVLLMLIAVPGVRANVLAFLRIGTIRIAVSQPTATTLQPPPTSAAIAGAATATPVIKPLTSVLDLAGATTLAEAQRRAPFTIRLPSYPPDLGAPQRVFFQDLGGPAVVLVWMDPAQPDRVRLSLHQLSSTTFAQKGQPSAITQTEVNGHEALWTDGPYMLEYLRGNQVPYGTRRLVSGHVLLWEEQNITYRLETDLSIDQAVQIAKSLR
jgi:hypothetical protein